MTDDEAKALGERAVRCPAWRWMAGMLTMEGQRIVRATTFQDGTVQIAFGDFVTLVWGLKGVESWSYITYGAVEPAEAPIPDLRDAGTVGCVLALVREAFARPTLSVHFDIEITSQGSWCIEDDDGGLYMGDTEAGALVSALGGAT